jgi:hypothetical protein
MKKTYNDLNFAKSSSSAVVEVVLPMVEQELSIKKVL